MEKARVFADEIVRFKIAARLRILYDIKCKNLGTLEKFHSCSSVRELDGDCTIYFYPDHLAQDYRRRRFCHEAFNACDCLLYFLTNNVWFLLLQIENEMWFRGLFLCSIPSAIEVKYVQHICICARECYHNIYSPICCLLNGQITLHLLATGVGIFISVVSGLSPTCS